MEFVIKPSPASFQDFLTFQKAWQGKNSVSGGGIVLRLLLAAMGAAYFLNGLTDLLRGEASLFSGMYVLLGAAIVFLSLLRPYLRAYLQFRRSTKRHHPDSSVVFDDRKISVLSEGVSLQLEYGQIFDILHMKKRYYVALMGKRYLILPESDFVSGDPALFGDFLESRCAQKVQYIK